MLATLEILGGKLGVGYFHSKTSHLVIQFAHAKDISYPNLLPLDA